MNLKNLFLLLSFCFLTIEAYGEQRRAQPAPFDSIFPSSDYPGPTIGVPNTDPIYPITDILWKEFPNLKNNDIRINGWVNPSYNASTSHITNYPLSFSVVPNKVELQQLVVTAGRTPNTVQVETMDWGFRLTNLYGLDYRYTTAQGYFSEQLLKNNHLYGYDLLEANGQIYFPSVAQGMLVTVGRYISPPDIESPLAVQNYLDTHSLLFSFDTQTETGINAAIKFNDMWTLLIGVHSGSDMAPWIYPSHFPSLLALIRWVSADNNDSLWGGIDSLNNGKFLNYHDNLQEFNLTWSHRFTEKFFIATEFYYLYQFDAPKGGTCNFGPANAFGGGGCGPIIPGRSDALGVVSFIELKLKEQDFMSFKTDFLDDYQGQRTGLVSSYMSWALGLTHQFSSLFQVRPEIRYDVAFKGTPYNKGTKNTQQLFEIDAILRF